MEGNTTKLLYSGNLEQKLKRQVTDQKKISAKDLSDKELVFEYMKKYLQLKKHDNHKNGYFTKENIKMTNT